MFPRVNDAKTAFIVNGEPWLMVGANFWQAMNLGAVDEANGNRAVLLQNLKDMQALGINHLRIMAASEGPDDQPARMIPSLMPSPGKYNTQVFEGLDYALDVISKHNFTVTMQLNNFWSWSGGMAQYVNWATGNKTQIPYPPQWPDFKGGDYATFTRYAARFYNDPAIYDECQRIWREHIKTVILRRNTVNGRIYRDDPTIFSWELANEPVQSADSPAKWIEDTANYIKSLDPNHMVTVGVESKFDKNEFTQTHNHKNIDYATSHCWVENWGIYNASDPSPENLKRAEDFALSFLANTSTWAKSIKKPIVLEEFGMARDAFSGPKASPSTPTTNKDHYYKTIFSKIVDLEKQGGYAGFAFWAYSGVARPNETLWIGDPPHELPGWYSVYNKDTTAEVIKEYAKKTSEVLKS
ncbi:uncharacterized protein VTP21DRAFT_5220 [Calcarisporiella thermophila]|uniref:uncharacterized protein n=1 Tax=Calcarisporiella thermophila TaxID=911321 RepID=UPI003743E66C